MNVIADQLNDSKFIFVDKINKIIILKGERNIRPPTFLGFFISVLVMLRLARS